MLSKRNTPRTPYPDKAKDIFEVLGNVIVFPTVIISAIFTGKLLSETLGYSGIDERFIVVITAALLTVSEVVMFRRWARYRDGAALLIGLMIATTSIAGSVGYFQVQLQHSIIDSEEYRQQAAIVNNLIAATDPQKHPDTYLVARRDLQREMAKLDNIRHNGAGVGASFYRLIAQLLGWPLEAAALAVTLFVALVIESIIIYNAIHTYNTDAPPAEEKTPKLPVGFRQSNGVAPNPVPPTPEHTIINQIDLARQARAEKIQADKDRLKELLSAEPGKPLAYYARQIGRDVATVSRWRRELS